MAEYIDKWQAVANLIDAGLKDTAKAVNAIQFIPAADVVEVVRCRDCEYWQTGWKPTNAADGYHFCGAVGVVRSGEWFCADGERKDGDA